MNLLVGTACLLSIGLEAVSADAAPTYLDVTAPPYNAVGDAVWGVTDCTLTANSATVVCPHEIYSLTSTTPQVFIAEDGEQSDGKRTPHVDTIDPSKSSGHTIVLSNPVLIDTHGLQHVTSLTVDSGSASNTGTGYEFNSSQTLDCGACVKPVLGSDAVGNPALMEVVNVAGIASAGSGGTTSSGGTMGVCTVSATPAQTVLAGKYTSITVTLTMGHISGFGPHESPHFV